MSCGIGCRRGSDLVVLWLWCKPAATALVQPLAWEPQYAAGAALKKTKKKKKKKEKEKIKKKKENKAGCDIHHFYPSSLGWDLVTWHYATVSEAWKYNLAACLEEMETKSEE